MISGLVIGSVFIAVIGFIPFFDDGMFLEPFGAFFLAIASFAGLFTGSFLALRWICRTSLRSFLFGRGRKPDVKRAITAGAFMLAGLFVSSIPLLKNFTHDNDNITLIVVNLIFCLLFVWIQTTTEEIFFRGFFLRVPYGNEIPVLPRGLLFAFISSLFFMAVHLFNPEIQSQPFGADVLLGAASYFVGAFCTYICNLLIGGMEAGLVFHFFNNFYCFFLVRAQVTVLETPSIFIDTTRTNTGTTVFIQELFMYIPPLLYLLWSNRRRSVPKENP
ncbi:MAG: CPBP family intramembrane metalloprotease [Lachnospiraceae bacterium]|nr:CPBP family intramembrane metalloprotease [Lachnospiraceae bacterium]